MAALTNRAAGEVQQLTNAQQQLVGVRIAAAQALGLVQQPVDGFGRSASMACLQFANTFQNLT
ncbi:hypothetical protein [Cupriavidus sp. PET2-C1]